MAENEFALTQLTSIYEAIDKIYSNASNWIGILLTANAALIVFGIDQDKPLAILLGGVICLVLAHQVSRVGQTIGALAISAFVWERDMGIPCSKSPLSSFLISFRGRDLVEKLWEIASLSDEKRLEYLEHSSEYRVFGLVRSRTFDLILLGAVTQIGYVLLIVLGVIH